MSITLLPNRPDTFRLASGDRPSGAYRTQAAAVLRRWRAVDRRLRALEPGPEADLLLAELLSLRADYLALVDVGGDAPRAFPVSDRYLLSS